MKSIPHNHLDWVHATAQSLVWWHSKGNATIFVGDFCADLLPLSTRRVTHNMNVHFLTYRKQNIQTEVINKVGINSSDSLKQ